MNRVMRAIIKFIYGQIFSRVDLSKRYAAVNRISDRFAQLFMRVPRKCRRRSVDIRGIPGEWIDADFRHTDRCLLFIHGGGFCLFSTVFYREMVGRIAQAARARALSFNYRLAPMNPFPAALEDSLTAYEWLLSTGAKASRVAVIGDSAGGGLVLSLLQTLRDRKISLPACAVCISPWADLTLSGEGFEERRKKDHLMRGTALQCCAAHYLQGQKASHPSVSPLFGDFSNLPPLLFQAGGEEVLLMDSVTAVEKSRAVGTAATLSVWAGQVHDFQLWAKILPDGRKAIQEIGRFVQKHIP